VLGLQRGDLARASAALTDYTRQRPDDAEAFYQLGLVQRQLKQPGQARQSLERALALAPNAPFAAEARKVLAELK
jgi:Flp pilus assembly protein TadD